MKVSDGTRTRDRRDHNPELYQLSYAHHERRSESTSGQLAPFGSERIFVVRDTETMQGDETEPRTRQPPYSSGSRPEGRTPIWQTTRHRAIAIVERGALAKHPGIVRPDALARAVNLPEPAPLRVL